MNYVVQELIQKILVFSGNFPSITAEDNRERISQLLDWVDNLTEDPWPEGESPYVGMLEAKQISNEIKILLNNNE